ncbi:GTP pyrophosphokinase [Hahella chejuensis KCTC 2396]|uniref:GTP pyrophosphokinase n=1 Tax=Hahella chejuensis (strain KCTC 2396) TaxID=349521 RepID=Q2SL26_HAHCH|nr:GTP diphosphokinase [Hahella chejuensis]ABC28648.1 GTP pyrophosphokinase [Hahella chejuensis KCTC 2396]
MVKVREDYPLAQDGSVDINGWIDRLQQQVELEDVASFRRACLLAKEIESEAVRAGNLWSEGSSSFLTGLEMTQILSELQLDSPSLIAAVLYRAVREGKLSLVRVNEEFGEEVSKLIEGVSQMAAISSLRHPIQGSVLGQTQTQVDNIRRMLVTMIDDVRVALIKLAERTCAIRDVKNAGSDKRHRVAREVFDIYAPLAHRLGIGYLKWELEDLSFRYLHETAYKKIAKLLDERRMDRQKFIEEALSALRQELEASGIKAELSGRAKHIYSIWRKMHRKGIDFSQVYDIRAIRILVPSIRDCYSALGVVHALWRHIPHEFDDYIANPKQNGYQSLHTAVVGPSGKIMEVQIRTQKMHEEAELGVCAHWLYKGTDTQQKSHGYEQKIAWLRQVLEWQDELGSKTSELVDQWRNDIVSDRIYVFTPDGHVIDLPAGSTPIDFAYKVHTEIGHACRGAKIHGRIVPLNYKLKTGDQVQILTSNQARPSRDWLNSDLGYANTSRARAKITHWFKLQDRDQNVEEGRDILQGVLKRLSLEQLDFDDLAQKVNYPSAEDMFAAIGAGDLKPMQVAHTAQNMLEPRDEQLTLHLHAAQESAKSSDVHIRGVGNLMTQMANCCKPAPGDPIVGYITIGRGVSIHRQDCINALQLQTVEPNRMIEVSWGDTEYTYPIDVVIEAYDRPGLLRDITLLLANEKINVTAALTNTDKKQSTADIRLTVEVTSIDVLGRMFDRIRRLPNIIDARRAKPGEG